MPLTNPPMSAPTEPAVVSPCQYSLSAIRSALCLPKTCPTSCPNTPANWSSFSNLEKRASVINICPPGKAKALMVFGSASK